MCAHTPLEHSFFFLETVGFDHTYRSVGSPGFCLQPTITESILDILYTSQSLSMHTLALVEINCAFCASWMHLYFNLGALCNSGSYSI